MAKFFFWFDFTTVAICKDNILRNHVQWMKTFNICHSNLIFSFLFARTFDICHSILIISSLFVRTFIFFTQFYLFLPFLWELLYFSLNFNYFFSFCEDFYIFHSILIISFLFVRTFIFFTQFRFFHFFLWISTFGTPRGVAGGNIFLGRIFTSSRQKRNPMQNVQRFFEFFGQN